ATARAALRATLRPALVAAAGPAPWPAAPGAFARWAAARAVVIASAAERAVPVGPRPAGPLVAVGPASERPLPVRAARAVVSAWRRPGRGPARLAGGRFLSGLAHQTLDHHPVALPRCDSADPLAR